MIYSYPMRYRGGVPHQYFLVFREDRALWDLKNHKVFIIYFRNYLVLHILSVSVSWKLFIIFLFFLMKLGNYKVTKMTEHFLNWSWFQVKGTPFTIFLSPLPFFFRKSSLKFFNCLPLSRIWYYLEEFLIMLWSTF